MKDSSFLNKLASVQLPVEDAPKHLQADLRAGLAVEHGELFGIPTRPPDDVGSVEWSRSLREPVPASRRMGGALRGAMGVGGMTTAGLALLPKSFRSRLGRKGLAGLLGAGTLLGAGAGYAGEPSSKVVSDPSLTEEEALSLLQSKRSNVVQGYQSGLSSQGLGGTSGQVAQPKIPRIMNQQTSGSSLTGMSMSGGAGTMGPKLSFISQLGGAQTETQNMEINPLIAGARQSQMPTDMTAISTMMALEDESRSRRLAGQSMQEIANYMADVSHKLRQLDIDRLMEEASDRIKKQRYEYEKEIAESGSDELPETLLRAIGAGGGDRNEDEQMKMSFLQKLAARNPDSPYAREERFSVAGYPDDRVQEFRLETEISPAAKNALGAFSLLGTGVGFFGPSMGTIKARRKTTEEEAERLKRQNRSVGALAGGLGGLMASGPKAIEMAARSTRKSPFLLPAAGVLASTAGGAGLGALAGGLGKHDQVTKTVARGRSEDMYRLYRHLESKYGPEVAAEMVSEGTKTSEMSDKQKKGVYDKLKDNETFEGKVEEVNRDMPSVDDPEAFVASVEKGATGKTPQEHHAEKSSASSFVERLRSSTRKRIRR